MFRTALSGQVRFITDSGSPEKILYEGMYMKDGTFDLVEKGIDNLYDYIQSFKDSVDIHVIIKKYMNGDLSAFNQREGVYADISGIPDNFIDIYNLVEHAKSTFNALPLEVRDKFGNNFVRFAGSVTGLEDSKEVVDKPVENSDNVGKEEIA